MPTPGPFRRAGVAIATRLTWLHAWRVAATPLQRQGVVIPAAVCRESVPFGAAAADGHRTGHPQNLRPGTPAAEHAAIVLLERSTVMAASRSLPRRQREALVLRYYGSMNESQMASVIDISRGAVKNPTGRAMSALRSILEAKTQGRAGPLGVQCASATLNRPAIESQSVRLSANSARPARRSTDGQAILDGQPSAWELSSDLGFCGAPYGIEP